MIMSKLRTSSLVYLSDPRHLLHSSIDPTLDTYHSLRRVRAVEHSSPGLVFTENSLLKARSPIEIPQLSHRPAQILMCNGNA